MGKKGDKKRKLTEVDAEEIEQEHEANELEAELAAIRAMKAEQYSGLAESEDIASGDEEEGDVGYGGKKRKLTPYNRDGLLRACESIGNATLPFVETLQVCSYPIEIADDNDDLEREMAFYNQTLLAVKAARVQLDAAGVPSKRPTDFFCENVKSDAHMNRIKDRLILEEKKIDAFEKRRQRENNRKYNKQVSDLRKQEKAQHVKQEIETVTRVRKGQATDGQQDLDRVINGKAGAPIKSKKRMNMDKKYGAGIKEKMKNKLNDKKSLNDLSDFNPRGGKFVRRESAGGRGGGRGGDGRGGRGGGRGGTGRGSGGRGGGGGGGGEGGGRFRKKESKPNRPGKEARTKRRSGNAGRG